MLKFTKDHEWLRIEGDIATIGITQHAQEQLGDLVFIELPAPGRDFEKGAAAAVVESVKAASDVYAPLAGEVIAVNATVTATPEQVNQDPYAAWLFRLKPADAGATAKLLDARAYEATIGDA